MSCAARLSETTSLEFILNLFKFFFTANRAGLEWQKITFSQAVRRAWAILGRDAVQFSDRLAQIAAVFDVAACCTSLRRTLRRACAARGRRQSPM